MMENAIAHAFTYIENIAVSRVNQAIDLLRKYSSHRINQSCNQIYP